jgi:pimeloyl-ACP methyl ester carboxylesterase
MTAPTRRVLHFEDGEISFLEWSAEVSAPTLVFSHANGFNASTYSSLLAPLAGRFRIIAWDMRGHGETSLPLDPQLLTGWRVFRDDLIRLLDRLAIRGAILAGHSLGATTSMLTAAARPDLARALVLAEPVMPTDGVSLMARLARPLGWSARVNPLAGMALKRRAQFASREEAVKRFTGRGAFATWPVETIADYVATGLTPEGDGFRLSCPPDWEAAAFSVFPFRLAALGGRIGVPVTVLTGTKGSATRPPVLEGFMRRHGKVRHLVLDGATHFLPMEFPERVREEILRAAGAQK